MYFVVLLITKTPAQVRRLLFILFSVLTFLASFAQEKNPPTFQKNSSAVDSCLILLNYAQGAINTKDKEKRNKGLQHGLSAYQIANRIKNDSLIFKTSAAVALGYFYFGQITKAKLHYEIAENKVTSLPQKSQALLYRKIGVFYSARGIFDRGIEYFEKALCVFEDLNDLKNIGMVHTNIGTALRSKGNLEEAQKHFFSSLGIFQSLNEPLLMARTNGNIAKLYRKLGEPKRAELYWNKALSAIGKNGHDDIRANAYNSFGLIAKDAERYDDALKHFNKSLILQKQIGTKSALSTLYAHMAIVYRKIDSLSLADKYANEGFELAKATRNKWALMETAIQIGQVYKVQDRLDDALLVLEEGRATAKRTKSTHLVSFNQYLAEIYAIKKDTLKAYAHLVQYVDARDSIYNKEKAKAVLELEEKYNSVQNQLTISEQNLQIKNRNISILLLVLLTLVLTAFTLLYRRNQRIAILETEMAKQKSKELYHLNQDLSDTIEQQKLQLQTPAFLAAKKIQLTSGGKPFVPLGDIVYIEAKNNLVEVVTTTDTFREWQRLKNIKAILPEQLFVQIHKSYIVNVTHIYSALPDSVVLSNGDRVKVTKTYRDLLFRALEQLKTGNFTK